MKTWLAVIAGLLLLAILGVATGMVQIHYLRMIDNPVLNHPVEVAHVAGTQIFLKDGRVIELGGGSLHSGWDRVLEHGGEVEIDPSNGENGFVTLWGSRPRFVCGGTAALRIPLIPCDVEGNERALIGFGEFVEGDEEEYRASGRPSF